MVSRYLEVAILIFAICIENPSVVVLSISHTSALGILKVNPYLGRVAKSIACTTCFDGNLSDRGRKSMNCTFEDIHSKTPVVPFDR